MKQMKLLWLRGWLNFSFSGFTPLALNETQKAIASVYYFEFIFVLNTRVDPCFSYEGITWEGLISLDKQEKITKLSKLFRLLVKSRLGNLIHNLRRQSAKYRT